MQKLFCTIAATLLLFTSCSDDDASSETTTKLRMGNYTALSRSAVTMEDSKGNSFSLSEARIGVRYVEFETALDSSYKVQGPFVVNLLTATSSPEIVTTSVPAGEYSRIDVRIDDTDSDFPDITSADPLWENSLYGKGTYDGDKPFEISLKFNEDVRFDFTSPVAITTDAVNTFNLALNLSEWFAELDLTDCIDQLSGSDSLIISDENGTCPDVEDDLKRAVKTLYDLDKN